MRKIGTYLLKIRNRYMGFYSGRSWQEMMMLSILFLLGFLWPLIGTVVYLFVRFRKESLRPYGVMALSGTILNLVMYLIQIGVKLCMQI